MAAVKAHNSNRKPYERLDPTTDLSVLWKSSAVDLPLMLISESLRFMGQRLQAQADHIASLSQCRSVAEAFESQASFARTTVSDYVAETGTLMNEAQSVIKAREAA